MADPKPITITQVDTEDYSGRPPQPFAVIGTFPIDPALQAILDDFETRIAALEP
jgi:hypothetical protein